MTGGDTNGNHPLFDFIGQNIHRLGDRVQLEARDTKFKMRTQEA